MQTECVTSNSSVVSTPSTTFQTPSMLVNNYYDRIDRVGSGNYFKTSHAINASKPENKSYTCPHVYNTRNVGSSVVVVNDFISQVKEIFVTKYPVRASGPLKEIKEQVTKTQREFGFKTMDHAESYKESYLGHKRNSRRRAGMVLENKRPTVDQNEKSGHVC
jgi:hypothetical protein